MTIPFKKSPLIALLVTSILVSVSYTFFQHHVLTTIIKNDQYISFTAIVEDIEQTSCNIDLGEVTSKTECIKAEFTEPETGKKEIVEIVEQSNQLRGDNSVKEGDYIRINKVLLAEGLQFVFNGFDRSLTYFWMIVVFILTVILIGGKRGFRSIFSLIISVILIVKVIIPLIISGQDPIYVVLIIGFLMFSAQIYLTNGFNKQSHSSILGALVGIGASAILAGLFSNASHITGFGDENSGFLAINAPNNISVRDIVVASFILGVLGVIDDATVSQVSVVSELLTNNPKIDKLQLFRSAMKVGASHIGSLMNTLFIAYVASALPLMTLLSIYNPNIIEIINLDLFAEEIVRTLVGSLGLVISIPAATYFATSLLTSKDVKKSLHNH